MAGPQYVPGERQAYPAGAQVDFTKGAAAAELYNPTLMAELEVLGSRIADLSKLEGEFAFQAARLGGSWPESPEKPSELRPMPDNALDQLVAYNRSLHRLWNQLSDHKNYIANKLG